jgi:hypothetical protein
LASGKFSAEIVEQVLAAAATRQRHNVIVHLFRSAALT